MESLARLFGSAVRVKLLRLFFFNPVESFTSELAALRAKVSLSDARTELLQLKTAGCIRRVGNGAKAVYRLNPRYEYFEPLNVFIRTTTIVKPEALITSLKKV